MSHAIMRADKLALKMEALKAEMKELGEELESSIAYLRRIKCKGTKNFVLVDRFARNKNVVWKAAAVRRFELERK